MVLCVSQFLADPGIPGLWLQCLALAAWWILLSVQLALSSLHSSVTGTSWDSSPELFSSYRSETLYPLDNPPPSAPPYCLYEFGCFRYPLVCKWSHALFVFHDRRISLSMLTSGFIRAVAWCGIYFLFKAKWYAVVCLCPFWFLFCSSIDRHLGASVNVGMQVSFRGPVFRFLELYQAVEWLGHMVVLISRGASMLFSKVVAPFMMPPTAPEVLISPHAHW